MVKLALVGLGKWGINYVNTIEKMKDCELTHIVSLTTTSLSRFPLKYTKLTNYLDLLKINTIDGVIIATPGSTHFELVKNLVHKYPLLVEKPLTLKMEESLQIKKMVKKNNSMFMVGHIYLYNPAYQKIKSLVPTIGEIRYIRFTGYNYGPIRNDMSSLWEYAPHGISMFIDIMRDLPLTVSAWSIDSLRPKKDLCDIVYIKCTFKSSIECVMDYGWLYPFKRRELIIYGSKQTLVLDELAEKKVSLFENLGPKVTSENVTAKRVNISYPVYKIISPLEVELNTFIKMIKQYKQPLTNINQGIDVMRVVSAAEKSINNKGEKIKI